MISATTLNDIVEYIHSNSEYNRIISNFIFKSGFVYDYSNDIKQELYLNILEGPVKLIDMYNRGEFKYWFIKMTFNQICSKKSSMYSKFLKKNIMNDEYEEHIHIIENKEDVELNIDDKYIFNLLVKIAGKNVKTNADQKRNFEIFFMYYVEDMTMAEISKQTSIPVSNVYKYIKFTRDFLKKEIDKNLFNDYGSNYI